MRPAFDYLARIIKAKTYRVGEWRDAMFDDLVLDVLLDKRLDDKQKIEGLVKDCTCPRPNTWGLRISISCECEADDPDILENKRKICARCWTQVLDAIENVKPA
jgi:hypothetical protein